MLDWKRPDEQEVRRCAAEVVSKRALQVVKMSVSMTGRGTGAARARRSGTNLNQ